MHRLKCDKPLPNRENKKGVEKMKSLINSLTVALAFLIVHPFSSLADELDYALKGCGTSEAMIIDNAGDITIGQSISRGITESVPPGGAFDNMTYECRSVWHASIEGGEFTNRCTFVDIDGDKTLGISAGSFKGWEWRFIGGTGKWKGITGGGPSGPVGKFGRLSETVNGYCWQGKGK